MQEETTQTIPQLVDDVRADKLSRRRLMHRFAAHGLSAAAASTVAGAASRTPAAPKASAPVVHPGQERAQDLKLPDTEPCSPAARRSWLITPTCSKYDDGVA